MNIRVLKIARITIYRLNSTHPANEEHRNFQKASHEFAEKNC